MPSTITADLKRMGTASPGARAAGDVAVARSHNSYHKPHIAQ
ncbi:MAG: hypothetical protein QOF16_1689 [Actinomycetota bacterium]|nr:hypothetical protein [Actinomycetota bacterium]MEA2488035.1 hypothetical protein [Actinomycetota bacterium]